MGGIILSMRNEKRKIKPEDCRSASYRTRDDPSADRPLAGGSPGRCNRRRSCLAYRPCRACKEGHVCIPCPSFDSMLAPRVCHGLWPIMSCVRCEPTRLDAAFSTLAPPDGGPAARPPSCDAGLRKQAGLWISSVCRTRERRSRMCSGTTGRTGRAIWRRCPARRHHPRRC